MGRFENVEAGLVAGEFLDHFPFFVLSNLMRFLDSDAQDHSRLDMLTFSHACVQCYIEFRHIASGIFS